MGGESKTKIQRINDDATICYRTKNTEAKKKKIDFTVFRPKFKQRTKQASGGHGAARFSFSNDFRKTIRARRLKKK